MYTLEQKLGAAILRTVPLSFCLTVPAIWSELAKEKTLKACKNAGITSESDIMIVSEPEAAAIYALHGLDPHGLQTGDTFVLCDAGGGTVDLISYTITKLRPTLQVKEAAQGTGGLCGSAFLNRRFGEFLKKRLGGEEGWDDEILAEAMERFDTVVSFQSSRKVINSKLQAGQETVYSSISKRRWVHHSSLWSSEQSEARDPTWQILASGSGPRRNLRACCDGNH